MKILKTKSEINDFYNESNLIKRSIGFIPTMGALHEGHLQLIREAQKINDIIIVSIFVNPMQFNNQEDFAKYPNLIEKDIEVLEAHKVDGLFLPDANYIYQDNSVYQVIEKEFSKKLCGANRPGHFEGVLTVLMKLFNLIKPQRVYMGKKDYQQYNLVQNMVAAFFLDIKIIGIDTVRDEYGLALSSRNLRLSKDGLNKARKVNQIILKQLKNEKNIEAIREQIMNLDIHIDYLEEINQRIFIAFIIEDIRLIDNFSLNN